MAQQQVRNNSVDIFRLVCSIGIVMIHTTLFGDWRDESVIYRLAIELIVPYFFGIAGYFYIRSLFQGKASFKKYAMGLLRVYTFWSIIYFSLQYIKYVHFGDFPVSDFFKKEFLRYFLWGSATQLWFVPALFYSIAIITLLHKLHILKWGAYLSLLLYVLGALGNSYLVVGNHILWISDFIHWQPYFDIFCRIFFRGVPGVMMGYFILILAPKWQRLSSKTFTFILVVVLFLALAETQWIVNYWHCWMYNACFLYPLVALIICALLRNPLPTYIVTGYYGRTIADFVYFSHPIFMGLVSLILTPLHLTTYYHVLLFVLTVVATSLTGYLIARSRNKWLMKYVV